MLTFEAYQRWFLAYDTARGLDEDRPLESLAHLSEEIGEIARHVLRLEGVKALDAPERAEEIDALALELSDAFVFLTKLANAYGIRWETTMQRAMEKAETRWNIQSGQEEAARRQRARDGGWEDSGQEG